MFLLFNLPSFADLNSIGLQGCWLYLPMVFCIWIRLGTSLSLENSNISRGCLWSHWPNLAKYWHLNLRSPCIRGMTSKSYLKCLLDSRLCWGSLDSFKFSIWSIMVTHHSILLVRRGAQNQSLHRRNPGWCYSNGGLQLATDQKVCWFHPSANY